MGYRAGIDIGTTYSAAAVHRDGATVVFELGGVSPSMPSVAYFTPDAQLLVGEPAGRRASSDPGRAALQFKRRLGDPAPFLLAGTPYSADALVAAMLADITARIEEREGSSPELVVITHPANYTEYKLDLLAQAARQAGLDHTAFLTEPEAAATHYAGEERIDPGESILVYDFGGGTFDAAVLSRTDDGFELGGVPEGLERLGGIDIDDAVFSLVRASLGDVVDGLDADDPDVVAALVRLRAECRIAKEALSEDVDASIAVMLPNAHTTVRLTRMELEDMIRPRIRDTLDASRRAIRSCDMADDDIDRVLLVGGTSRIPLVREMVREAFGAPVSLDTHPKHSVALGAARHGAGAVAPVGPSPVSEAPAPLAVPPVSVASSGSPDPPVTARPADEPADTEAELATVAPEPGGEPAGRRLSPIAWGVAIGLVLVVGVVLFLALSGGDGSDTADVEATDGAPSETEPAGSVAAVASADPAPATSPPTLAESDDQASSTTASVAGGFVADDTGLFGAEIPEGWSDIETSPITIGGGETAPAIVAAPDRAAFASSVHAPGLAIWYTPSPYDEPFDEMGADTLQLALADIVARLSEIRDDVDSSFERGSGFCRYAPRTILESAAVPYAGGVVVNEECGNEASIWTVHVGWFEARPDLEFTLAHQTRTDEGGTLADASDFLDSVVFLDS